jgi:hypothetical protein
VRLFASVVSIIRLHPFGWLSVPVGTLADGNPVSECHYFDRRGESICGIAHLEEVDTLVEKYGGSISGSKMTEDACDVCRSLNSGSKSS